MTSVPVLPNAEGGDGQEGEGIISTPTPPHGIEVVGPVLQHSHFQGWLTSAPYQGPVLLCCPDGVQGLFLLSAATSEGQRQLPTLVTPG